MPANAATGFGGGHKTVHSRNVAFQDVQGEILMCAGEPGPRKMYRWAKSML
jgi:hypothetical protein